METDKMDSREFARELSGLLNGLRVDEAHAIIASRDAYLERRALEAAAERAVKEVTRQRYTGVNMDQLRAAILGEPRFVKGQLVREKIQRRRGAIYEAWLGHDEVADAYEPVKVRIDEAGRAIVEEP